MNTQNIFHKSHKIKTEALWLFLLHFEPRWTSHKLNDDTWVLLHNNYLDKTIWLIVIARRERAD